MMVRSFLYAQRALGFAQQQAFRAHYNTGATGELLLQRRNKEVQLERFAAPDPIPWLGRPRRCSHFIVCVIPSSKHAVNRGFVEAQPVSSNSCHCLEADRNVGTSTLRSTEQDENRRSGMTGVEKVG